MPYDCSRHSYRVTTYTLQVESNIIRRKMKKKILKSQKNKVHKLSCRQLKVDTNAILFNI